MLFFLLDNDSSRYEYSSIGEQVTISFGVAIFVHDYSIVHAARTLGKSVSSIIYKPVKIGNNVFIGAKNVILQGAAIGDNVVIATNSSVNKDIPSGEAWGGVPAHFIMTAEEFINKHKTNLGKHLDMYID